MTTREILAHTRDAVPLFDGQRVALITGESFTIEARTAFFVTLHKQRAPGDRLPDLERFDDNTLHAFKATFANAADVLAFYRGKTDPDAMRLRALADAIQPPHPPKGTT